MAEKKICPGSGLAPVQLRQDRAMLAKCGVCGRIGRPISRYTAKKDSIYFLMRQHSVKGRTTTSHDSTMGILWDHAKVVGGYGW